MGNPVTMIWLTCTTQSALNVTHGVILSAEELGNISKHRFRGITFGIRLTGRGGRG